MVQDIGTIDFSIRYQKGKLDIKIIGCRNLKKSDLISKSDPYVKLFVLPGKHSLLKTKTVKNNQNPTYNSTFSFSLSRDAAIAKTAVFQVYDDDTFTKDDPIGEARFALREFGFTEGEERTYNLKLQKFTESPPKVEAYRPPIQPQPVIQDPPFRPNYVEPVPRHDARPSMHVDHSLNDELRSLNVRLEEIIRKNRGFFEINDDLLITLISQQIEEIGQIDQVDFKESINRNFGHFSDEIVQLAQLQAESDALEYENSILRQRIANENERLQAVRNEEARLNRLIKTEEATYRELTVQKSGMIDDYPNILRNRLDQLHGEIVVFREKKERWYYDTLFNEIEMWKMEIFKRESKKQYRSRIERTIESPTITWNIVKAYVERIGEVFIPEFDFNPFLILLEKVGHRYSNYVTSEQQEIAFKNVYSQLLALEKALCEIRQKRCNLRFIRDEARFNFLGEIKAKKEALAFLDENFKIVMAETLSAPGGLDYNDVRNYCQTVGTELEVVESRSSHWVSRDSSVPNSITLRPEVRADNTISYRVEPH